MQFGVSGCLVDRGLLFFSLLDNQKTFSIRCVSVAWVPKSLPGRQIDLYHRAADCRRGKVAGPLTWAGSAKGLG